MNYIIEFFSSFPNDVCKAGTKNGTCYTQAECTERNGEESGSCASGFGVCCVCKYLIKKDLTIKSYKRIKSSQLLINFEFLCFFVIVTLDCGASTTEASKI